MSPSPPKRLSLSVEGMRPIWAMLPLLFLVSGCGEFFSRESTKTQNEQIFRSLSQIEVVPDANRPLPGIYTAEPKILPTKAGATLFYFTLHHPPATLASLVRGQLVDLVSPNPVPGKDPKAGPMVDENPATNQLIIHCQSSDDAKLVL